MLLIFALLIQASLAVAAANFADSDLQTLINQTRIKGHSTIVYGWSPHMPLSVRGLNELNRLGRQSNLTIVPVLDPGAIESLATQVVRREGWPMAYMKRAASPRLFALGFRVHYPSYLLISQGRLSSDILPGYKTPDTLQSTLRKHL